jgi:hypothetical protein
MIMNLTAPTFDWLNFLIDRSTTSSDKARSRPYIIDTTLFGGGVLCRTLELATIFIKELEGDIT